MSFSLESYFILSYILLFYVKQRNSLTLRASVLRNFLGISQHSFSFLFLSTSTGDWNYTQVSAVPYCWVLILHLFGLECLCLFVAVSRQTIQGMLEFTLFPLSLPSSWKYKPSLLGPAYFRMNPGWPYKLWVSVASCVMKHTVRQILAILYFLNKSAS